MMSQLPQLLSNYGGKSSRDSNLLESCHSPIHWREEVLYKHETNKTLRGWEPLDGHSQDSVTLKEEKGLGLVPDCGISPVLAQEVGGVGRPTDEGEQEHIGHGSLMDMMEWTVDDRLIVPNMQDFSQIGTPG